VTELEEARPTARDLLSKAERRTERSLRKRPSLKVGKSNDLGKNT
jgi:hypothetical protein